MSSLASRTPDQPGRMLEEATISSGWVIGAGRPTAVADHELPLDSRLLEQLVDEAARSLEAALDVVAVLERDPAPRQHPMAEIADRDGEVAGADVDADRDAGGDVQPHLA